MPKPLLEQATLIESVDKKSGKILVDIVTPGIGSSGYYSPEVCEAAAGLVTAGTQMYLDHPTAAEEQERPIRSVKDIAAVFTESARWDPSRGEAGSLVAEAQVVPAWVETMGVIQGAIGVSLRGSATDIVEGEVDGRRMAIVEGLHSIDSVDFVTRAGRGGMFSLMESANPTRVHERAIGHGVSEATVNDTREALQNVLRDAYGGDKTYVWVRDFDDVTVWFEVEDSEGSGIYGQDYYSSEANGVSLVGEWTEVRVVTSYVPTDTSTTESVPVTRPDSTNPTTEADQEVTMGNIQIDEAEHSSLVEKAGRVDVLERENVTLKESAASRDRRDRAREIISERATEKKVTFSDREVKGLLADITVAESGALDETAFTTLVDKDADAKLAEAAAAAEAAGAGRITGFGGTTPPDNGEGISEAAFNDTLGIKIGA